VANELGELRRNNFQMLKDILLAASSGAVKTHIIYGSNINFKIFKDLAEYAKKHGLLVEIDGVFHITDKGREFCCRVIELEAMLREE